jgi:hypothetical protein
MESIGSQPGMKCINEPDHKAQLERHHALNIVPRWRWLSLTPRERSDLALFLLDDNRSGLFGPVNPFLGTHSWRTDRRVLKLVRMTALVEWLSSIGFMTVYILRHPIAQAQSCITRGHRIFLQEFLEDKQFLEKLAPDAVSYVRQVADNGEPLLQFITQWCLENVVALRSPLTGHRFALTTHELLVSQPVTETERLAQILDLKHVDRILVQARQPSRTSDTSSSETRDTIRAGQASRLLGAWRSGITSEEEMRLLEPLQVFGIDAYKYGEILPDLPSAWISDSVALDYRWVP